MPYLAVAVGFGLLLWSADRFVMGAAATARHFGMSALLIGMLVVGFGTSAPEILVSILAAAQGNPGLALGNAYGSNIANIGLILGVAALISPLRVHSQVLRKELPILLGFTALAGILLSDGYAGRGDGAILLLGFTLLTIWQINADRSADPEDSLAVEVREEITSRIVPLKRALFWLIVGLFLLVASSRILVWGAVEIATALGVDDVIIGLTIVAIGTSLPELASTVVAARKNEHDLALGNIIGSNLFNSLLVVPLAVVIAPTETPPELLVRDWTMMAGLTVFLFIFGYGFRGREGRINRVEGALFALAYVAYTCWLIARAAGLA